MKKHAVISGSVAGRIRACPGWLRLLNTLPPEQIAPNTSSPAAALGELIHDALEAELKGEPLEFGHEVSGVVYDAAIQLEHVNPMLALFDQFEAEIGTLDFELEAEVHHPDIPESYGHVDVVGRVQGRPVAVVLDWKSGFYGVPAKENAQMLFYAKCAMHDPKTKDLFDGVEEVILAIVQPRDGGLKQWRTTPAEIEEHDKDLQAAIWEASAEATVPLAEIIEEGEHCGFCPVAGSCPAKTEKALLLAQALGTHEPAAEGATAKEIKNAKADEAREAARSVDNTKLGQFLVMIDDIAVWKKGLHDEAMYRLGAGEKIPGFRLGEGRGNRVYVSEEKAEAAIARKGLSAADRRKVSLKSPAQIEKLFAAMDVKFDMDKHTIRPAASDKLVREGSDTPEPINLAGELSKLLTAI
jgi:hypothetical protein